MIADDAMERAVRQRERQHLTVIDPSSMNANTGSTKRPAIWLLQDGEPLPIDDHPRLMRTGDLARQLVKRGFSVVWWTSRFNHNLKLFRSHPHVWFQESPHAKIALLNGGGYATNMSLRRVLHYRAIAEHFGALADTLATPALVLGSYPSPELCDAGRRYARRQSIPFVLDIRDPWPDIFSDYVPSGLRWMLSPLLWYYRRKIVAIARDATSIVAVSRAMLDWGLRYAGRAATERDCVLHIGFRRHGQEREISVPRHFTKELPMVCLFATTCGQSYNGDLLIDAAQILEARGEHRIRFVITGDGDMRAAWLKRASGLPSVQFTGWISNDEMQAHFFAAHIGMVLMRGGITRFWLGNKIFEYLSASLGVINNVPGEAADLLLNHGVGESVDREDPQSLATALRALADQPEHVRVLMERARLVFEQQFDRDVIQERYVNHLKQLLPPSSRDVHPDSNIESTKSHAISR